MIFAGVQRVDPRIDTLQRVGIPFATLGRSTQGNEHAWIDPDLEGAAGARLVAGDHHRIAVTVPHSKVNFNRVFPDACKQALARQNLPFDAAPAFATRRDDVAGYEAMAALLDQESPPTAVPLIYEVTAIGIYRKLQECGLKPGRGIALLGFRDEPTIPALTCFHSSLAELGNAVGHP